MNEGMYIAHDRGNTTKRKIITATTHEKDSRQRLGRWLYQFTLGSNTVQTLHTYTRYITQCVSNRNKYNRWTCASLYVKEFRENIFHENCKFLSIA